MIPTQETIQKASQIIAEIERLQAEMLTLFGGADRKPVVARAVKAAAPAAVGRPAKKKRTMSAAGRARIAAAARARWARFHAARKGA